MQTGDLFYCDWYQLVVVISFKIKVPLSYNQSLESNTQITATSGIVGYIGSEVLIYF